MVWGHVLLPKHTCGAGRVWMRTAPPIPFPPEARVWSSSIQSGIGVSNLCQQCPAAGQTVLYCSITSSGSFWAGDHATKAGTAATPSKGSPLNRGPLADQFCPRARTRLRAAKSGGPRPVEVTRSRRRSEGRFKRCRAALVECAMTEEVRSSRSPPFCYRAL